jgi:membrane-associated phospholipid phosphatase
MNMKQNLRVVLHRTEGSALIPYRSRRHCRWYLVVIAMILLTCARPSLAHEPLGLTYNPAVDVPITAAAGAVTLGLKFGFGAGKSTYVQNTEEVNGIDTLAPDHQNPTYDVVSDGFLYGSMAVGLLAPTLAGVKNGQWWRHALLFGEALALSMSVTEVVKFAVRRPRPYTHDERTGDIGDDFSFFSGHAATTAVVLFFAARALDLTYHIPLWGRLSLYLGAAAITATVSVLRVAAGKHYPTDVIVGALVGASIGFLVPELHRQKRAAVSAAPLAGGGAVLTLMGNF